jgi:hypothetical protein
MPTKTNSPLHIVGAVAKTGLKGLIGEAAKANPIGAVLTGAQALFGGIKEVVGDRKEAKAAGEKYKFLEGVKDFGAGALKGVTGVDLTDQNNYEEEVPEYSTNIDPMTGQEIDPMTEQETPLTMSGKPLKMLTGVNSPMTYKMSAAQYKSGLKMSEISGANTLPSALNLKGNQYKIDANKDGKITGEDFKLL